MASNKTQRIGVRTVDPADRLLGRGANPKTGLVTPSEATSLISGQTDQKVYNPKYDHTAVRGCWQTTETGWKHIATVDGSVIEQQQQRKVQLAVSAIDPATPPTPPDSASQISSTTKELRRKPVPASVPRTPSECTATSSEIAAKQAIARQYQAVQAQALRSAYGVGQDPVVRSQCRRQSQGCIPRSLRVGNVQKTSSQSRKKHSRPDNDSHNLYDRLETYESDKLNGWVAESITKVPVSRGKKSEAKKSQRSHEKIAGGFDAREEINKQRLSKNKSEPKLDTTIPKDDSSTKSRRSSISSIVTTASTGTVVRQHRDSTRKISASSQQHIAALRAIYRSLEPSLWLKEKFWQFVDCLLYMIHHIAKTFLGSPTVKGEKQKSILERNRPIELFLAVVYIAILLYGFKLVYKFMCSMDGGARSTYKVARWTVSWLKNICLC